MNISTQHAQEALREIDESAERMRRSMTYSGVAPVMILWGSIWMTGMLATYYLEGARQYNWIPWIWGVLNLVGFGVMGIINAYDPHQLSGQWRFGILWIVLFLHAMLWGVLFWPWNHYQFWSFLGMLIMFAWIVVGLWTELYIWSWSGMAISAAIFIVYLLCGSQTILWLWYGIVAGGMMILIGLFAAWRNRQNARA